MRARVLALLGPLLLSGCIQIGAPAVPPVTNVAAQSVRVGNAVITLEVGWMAVDMRRVKILVEVFNPGLIKSDSFYLDAELEGFYVEEGTPHLSFFMLPRQVHYHEVDYRLRDDANAGLVTIMLRPTHNGPPQWSTTLRFAASDRGPRLVGVDSSR